MRAVEPTPSPVRVSERLTNALKEVGPIAMPRRKRQGISLFLARAVIGQQLSVKAARSIWTRVENISKVKDVPISDLFVDEFFLEVRGGGVSRQKFTSITAIWEAEREGRLCDAELFTMAEDQRRRKLVAINGVGSWTYDMAQIFYFRLPDVWPETDVAVQKTFLRLSGRRSGTREAETFSPYRSFLALSMWRVVDGGR